MTQQRHSTRFGKVMMNIPSLCLGVLSAALLCVPAGCQPENSDDDTSTLRALGPEATKLLRVANLNIKHGGGSRDMGSCKHSGFGGDGPEAISLAMIGLRRYWANKAVATHEAGFAEMLITTQEVGAQTARVGDWDPPVYWKNKLNAKMDARGIDDWKFSSFFSGRPYKGGKFGMLSMSSAPVYNPLTRPLAVDDKPYQAFKVKAGTEWFWVINAHLAGGDLETNQAQREEILEFVETLSPTIHVLVLGDLNIFRDGYHRTKCPADMSKWGSECFEHQDAYWDMWSSFDAAGFSEIGEFDGPCWEQVPNACSFKATGTSFSRIDYAFLLVRDDESLAASVSVERPRVDTDCVLADHHSLIVDIGI